MHMDILPNNSQCSCQNKLLHTNFPVSLTHLLFIVRLPTQHTICHDKLHVITQTQHNTHTYPACRHVEA